MNLLSAIREVAPYLLGVALVVWAACVIGAAIRTETAAERARRNQPR